MNFRFILISAVAAFTLAPGAVLAQTANSVSSANNQHNSGSVVLNPSGGTQVNNNVNNAYSSTYSFGPGISCPTPSVAINTYGGGGGAYGGGHGSSSNSYGGSVSLIMPIGGDVGNSCRKLVAEIATQRVLDTKVNMIRVCADLARQGISVSVKDFPEFEACKSVTVSGRHAVSIETGPVFTEPSGAVPVVPVNKN